MGWRRLGKALCRAAIIVLMLPLAACGFHPLYAESHREVDQPALAAIVVMPIADRMIGVSLHYRGDQTDARRHIEHMLTHYVAPIRRSPSRHPPPTPPESSWAVEQASCPTSGEGIFPPWPHSISKERTASRGSSTTSDSLLSWTGRSWRSRTSDSGLTPRTWYTVAPRSSGL